MNSTRLSLLFKRHRIIYLIFICLTLLNLTGNGQEKPPKPISVTVSTLQHLNFGTIIPSGSSGGSVTVDNNGIRSSLGQIILPPVGTFCSPALFEVTALRGTLITIVTSPATLTGSAGGTLSLTLETPSTGTPFVARSITTDVYIGGTLNVGSLIANPSGFYSGTFTVSFIQN
jgi:Domain of unknown function (DUF4402)